jgi:hypothetical protein
MTVALRAKQIIVLFVSVRTEDNEKASQLKDIR